MSAQKKPAHERASEHVSAKLTPVEHAALAQLQARRAEALSARDEPPDATFAGWLRWIIRREAKAAGIPIDARPPASSQPPPAPPPPAPARRRPRP